MFNILVVEDDENTALLMTAVLKHAGYNVYNASNGLDALKVMEKYKIDLFLVDIMMPEMDGYELMEELRSCRDNTPILMVSAKKMPKDKLQGFRSGTDDYMVKPVNEEEMLLRIKALLRRAQVINEHKLHIGKVILDNESLTIIREGEKHTLHQKEFYLLFKLLSFPDRIFTRIQLMDEIWGLESESVDTTVNVHVNRLRKKIAHYPEFEIVAVRGIGYKAVIKNE